MAIKLPSGFKISVQEPVDNRLVLSKAEMLAIIDAKIPSNYVCVCKDDGKLYIWNTNFSASSTTGKFRSYEEVMDIAKALNTAMESPATKAALESVLGTAIPGAIQKAMESGSSAQQVADAMFNNEEFALNVDNKISLAISTIQAIDGMAE